MMRLDCGNCESVLDRLGRDRDRFDWHPIIIRDSRTGRIVERVHGFSRFNGRSLCGRQQR